MDIQEIAVYVIVAAVVVYFLFKIFGKKKPKDGCGPNCGCS
ncbi:MAG: FeoB-associated Cys-rich membrane protein [Flavobacterium sp.]|nr:FeoB-associated Cys-rich membrane protein [Candidatus Neoflavobacterium equi]